jgi:glycerol-3-phosphate acyltransferase PlsX
LSGGVALRDAARRGIAIDAMGGDRAPSEVVKGAVAAARQMPDLNLHLVGNEELVRNELEAAEWGGENIRIVPAKHVIEMGDSPIEALRRKRGSSIEEAVLLLRQGEADAVVSAGNTGACVAASTLRLGLLPRVKRAGIAVAFYAGDRPVIIIDVGANVASKPEHLIQYGIMASLYSRRILEVENPRVSLLNVGEEDEKGNRLTKETHGLFQKTRLNFVGNIEGVEIFRSASDVVVCDGFTGNIVLKVAEGLAERLVELFKEVLGQALDPAVVSTGEGGKGGEQAAVAAVLRRSLGKVHERLDYSEYGGAPLLGVNGVVIIAHGRSDAKAIFNAIRVARLIAELDLNRDITEEIQAFSERE